MAERFIDDYLLYLLARASALVSGQFHERLRPHGLDVGEWRVLATLSDGDGLLVGELATSVLFQQPTLTKILDRMERDGLVARRREDRDRRKVRVFVTSAGRRKVRGVLVAAKAHESEVLGEYTEDETESLKAVLRTLIDRNESTMGTGPTAS